MVITLKQVDNMRKIAYYAYMSENELVRASVSKETRQTLEGAAREEGLGLSMFLRTILEKWARAYRQKKAQEQQDREDGSTYGP